MFGFDQRLRLATGWLTERVAVLDGEGIAGWGWVADVHPDPQNTAEAACAYLLVGQEVPHTAGVVQMLERREPLSCHGHSIHRPLSNDVEAFAGTGMVVESLRAPRPSPTYVAAHPEAAPLRDVPLYLHSPARRVASDRA